MRIIGIDPGNNGAIALLNGGNLEGLWDMPVIQEKKRTVLQAASLISVFDEMRRLRLSESPVPPVVYLEKVGAMPGQGVTSMFNFGRSVGLLEGVCAAYGYRIVYAPPTRWKAQMGLSGRNKDASRSKAIECFPRMAELFKLKKYEGRAEAALIGLWGLRQEQRTYAASL